MNDCASLPAIVLASGLSARFSGGNKLLAEIGGEPIVRRTISAYAQAGLRPIIVVVGHDRVRVTRAVRGLPVLIVVNSQYAQGQSRALVRGLRAVDEGAEAAIIGVADQPELTPDTIRHLVGAYARSHPLLVVPRYAGKRGNPVVFARPLFPELLEVTGDVGGRQVIERHSGEIVWVDFDDTRSGVDVDTVEDYERVKRFRQ